MNAPDQKPASVHPLSAHIHETDDMTVQFASSELQDKLMQTLHAERMNALGITTAHDDDETHELRTVVIDDPEAVEKFREAMAAAGEDITVGTAHDIRHLNINLADLGLPPDEQLDLEGIDPAIRGHLMSHSDLSRAEQASAMLQQLWPVPGRLATTAHSNSVIREFYQECHLLQTEIILNTIEEIPDEDQTTLHGMLVAVVINPDISAMRLDSDYDDESIMKSAGVKRHRATRQHQRHVTRAVQEAYSDEAAGEDAAELVAETLAEWRE